MPAPPDFAPTVSLEALQRRAGLLIALREFFRQHDYWEVETPLLSHDCCVDAWLDPFLVPARPGHELYLQTSPEFAMKRLLCAGAQRICQVTRSFRRAELGPLHNPEFTIVEWYECGSDHHRQMEFVEQLVRRLYEAADGQGWSVRNRLPQHAFVRLSYSDAFQRYLGFSPWQATCRDLLAAAGRAGQSIPSGAEEDHDGLLNLLLAACIEPRFRELGAVFLFDYPASQAALARVTGTGTPVAERFELYLDGVEICNGYHEETNAAELRERFRMQNEKRLAAGHRAIPVESRFLQAIESGLPPCSGVALGFDRLVMSCLGKAAIQDVIPFPFTRA